VDQQPDLTAIATPDLEELVGQPAAGLGVGDDLLKLFVERLVAFFSVEGIVQPWEEEGENGFQEMVEGFLPGLSWSRRRCRFFRL
jgi:hypothetical protein